jgi:hypothetical protein
MNNINKEILEKLNECQIPIEEAMGFLIPLFYGYQPKYIPEELEMQILATTIVSYDILTGNVQWELPLFINENLSDPFDWVKTEYCKLFREINPSCPLMAEEAKRRMIKLFKEQPHIRKQDVIETTKMYLMNTSSQFIGEPHYFIEKGTGASKVQKILSWYEKYQEANKDNNESTHNSRILQ